MSVSRKVGAACLATTTLVAGACGSSETTAAASSKSSSPTYTIGLLTDVTGPAASAFKTTVQGVEAGVGQADSEGYHIKDIVADTGSSPSGALAAATKLVEQDHVVAVIGVSALTFAAAPYLTAHGVPVLGSQVDGPEWLSPKSTNMFSVTGTDDFTKVSSSTALFLKSQGVTTYGGIGYGISPSSAEAVKGGALSSQAEGIKVGFYDADFPYGGTNVGPDASKMKSAGVNGVVAYVYPSTAFALVTALRQQNVPLKAAVLSTGYGGDLISTGSAGEQAATGDFFGLSAEPAEMHTAATTQLQEALAKYAGVTTDPTYDEYVGYLSVEGFVAGLKAAGTDVTHQSLISALSSVRNFNGGGFLGPESINFGTKAMPAEQCTWYTKWTGSAFSLVSGADPICGSILPGLTVSSS